MSSPTLVPRSDTTVHLVLNDFGYLGCAYIETDEAKTDQWTIVKASPTGNIQIQYVWWPSTWPKAGPEMSPKRSAQAVFELGRRENHFSPSAREFVERIVHIALFPTE